MLGSGREYRELDAQSRNFEDRLGLWILISLVAVKLSAILPLLRFVLCCVVGVRRAHSVRSATQALLRPASPYLAAFFVPCRVALSLCVGTALRTTKVLLPLEKLMMAWERLV